MKSVSTKKIRSQSLIGNGSNLILLILVSALFGLTFLVYDTMPYILFFYALMSIVCFFLYAVDKKRAQNGGWRVPESRLHITALFGGWPGGLLAQKIFRHKTQKRSFQLVFKSIVGLHFTAWGGYLLFG